MTEHKIDIFLLKIGVNTMRFFDLTLTDHIDNYGWG